MRSKFSSNKVISATRDAFIVDFDDCQFKPICYAVVPHIFNVA